MQSLIKISFSTDFWQCRQAKKVKFGHKTFALKQNWYTQKQNQKLKRSKHP